MSEDLYALAPEGKIYMCLACGKTSRNRAGFLHDGDRETNLMPDGTRIAQEGWEESCMLRAELIDHVEFRPLPCAACAGHPWTVCSECGRDGR